MPPASKISVKDIKNQQQNAAYDELLRITVRIAERGISDKPFICQAF